MKSINAKWIALALFGVFSIWMHFMIKKPVWQRRNVPSSAETRKIETGQPAPDFSLPALDGKTMTLSELKGRKVVVIDFWATWCGPCRKAMPLLQDFYEVYRAKGVEIISVNQGEASSVVAPFIKQKEYTFPVVLDEAGSVGSAYGVRGIPSLYVVDRQGIVRDIHVGYDPRLDELLKKTIDPLLKP